MNPYPFNKTREEVQHDLATNFRKSGWNINLGSKVSTSRNEAIIEYNLETGILEFKMYSPKLNIYGILNPETEIMGYTYMETLAFGIMHQYLR